MPLPPASSEADGRWGDSQTERREREIENRQGRQTKTNIHTDRERQTTNRQTERDRQTTNRGYIDRQTERQQKGDRQIDR